MDVLEQIYILYCRINNIYLKLYFLELSGKRDSVSYLELVWILRGQIDEEKVLFDKLQEEYSDIYSYLCNLGGNFMPLGARLCDYLRNYRYFNIDSDGDSLLSDNINYTKMYGICFKNMILLYLSFLQEIINSVAFESVKEKLLNIKYNNSFIYRDVEEILVDFNFDVLRTNYVNLNVFADTLDLENNMGNNIILNCCLNVIKMNIEQLLNISDMDYNNDNKVCLSLNNQCLLRAALSLISERDYYEMEKQIYDEINRCSNNSNKVSADIVNSILEGRKKDKCRVRRISMTPIDD